MQKLLQLCSERRMKLNIEANDDGSLSIYVYIKSEYHKGFMMSKNSVMHLQEEHFNEDMDWVAGLIEDELIQKDKKSK